MVLTSSRSLWMWLLRHIWAYRLALLLAIIGDVLFSATDAVLTYSMKPVVNEGLIAKNMPFLRWLPLGLLGIIFVRSLAQSVGTYCMGIVSRGVILRLRKAMFDHLLRLRAAYYDRVPSGQVLSKMIFDIEQVAQASADAISELIQAGSLMMGLLAVMFTISWRLSLVYLGIVPMIGLLIRWVTRRLRKVSQAIQAQMGTVTNISREVIEGYHEIRAYAGETYEQAKFNAAAEKTYDRELKLIVARLCSSVGSQVAMGAMLALMLGLATSPSFEKLSPGDFMAMLVAMISILRPLKRFTGAHGSIQRGLSGAQSIYDLLQEPVEADTGTAEVDRVEGGIRFDRVSFSYPGSAHPALQEVSFEVPPGSTVALVGHSGSGKTTMTRLLERFYEVDTGAVLIEGVDIRRLTLASLRRQLAIIPQQLTLFHDTIRANIAYGCFEQTSEGALIDAARAAHALEFIESLPQGWDTVIGDNGFLLSGGQRQRIAIARAILKNAPILILDEATSALDTVSERLIQEAVETLIHGATKRTTLVIAHRLSTIERADQIIVLDHGRVVERGTHDELLRASGHYAAMRNQGVR